MGLLTSVMVCECACVLYTDTRSLSCNHQNQLSSNSTHYTTNCSENEFHPHRSPYYVHLSATYPEMYPGPADPGPPPGERPTHTTTGAGASVTWPSPRGRPTYTTTGAGASVQAWLVSPLARGLSSHTPGHAPPAYLLLLFLLPLLQSLALITLPLLSLPCIQPVTHSTSRDKSYKLKPHGVCWYFWDTEEGQVDLSREE